ncbi:Protein kinase family protein [Melia azedarach]|uniref:Protein kinase family protein n=1 Tax=Melia azedarach TaxID=155640 RepID=A0ACC1YJY5_MELAZ|nr:Protein kinase family protein [Melia azedarach]
MMRNGGYVLKEIIAASDGKYNPFRIFSAQELEIATNKYEEAFLEEQYYVLYKGFWEEQPISIMMFRNNMDNANKNAYERCINNIVYASQMSHKHILRLIGCCLDTEVPILVFESVRAVSLHDLIHASHTPNFESLLLTNRLKIATDIAHAVTYLHLGFPRPIIFRDIKSSNILFTEQNVAKLFDFSISKSIPKGEIHIILDDTTGVYGYFETEFVKRYYLNEKSDVYSFGVLLLDLFTGQKLLDPARAENFSDCHSAHHEKEAAAIESFCPTYGSVSQ